MKIVNAPVNQGIRYIRPSFRMGYTADGIFRMSGVESTPPLTSSPTANTEVIGFVNVDARNVPNLPRLAQIGATFSKFRLPRMHAYFKGETGTSANGAIAMALIYDTADAVAANWNMTKILATHQGRQTSIWDKSDPVRYDSNRAAVNWYISGTTAGVATQNAQTPVAIVYGFYTSLTSFPVGRIHIDYEAHFIEEIAPSANA